MKSRTKSRGTSMMASKSRRAWWSLVGFAAALIGPNNAWAQYNQLNMPVGVTPISRQAYDVHMLMFYISCLIGLVVFGLMIYSIIYHRKSRGYEPAQFHHSTFAEIVWTIIPFVILVAFAIPATKALIMMEDTGDADLTLKITGYQWKWKYDYIEDDVTLYSNLALSSRQAIYADPTKVENYLLDVGPELIDKSRNSILLHPERRYPPCVNNVTGGEDKADFLVDG